MPGGLLPRADAIADTGDSISTRQRSFLGHCEAVPTHGRFPPLGREPPSDLRLVCCDCHARIHRLAERTGAPLLYATMAVHTASSVLQKA
jgi:hypothetical protein